MTNYYIEKDNKIIIVETDKNIILNRQKHQPQYQNLEIKETNRPLALSDDGTYYIFADTPEYEKEQAQKEAERIKELSMTRSDFFDATIKAFGADESDFLPIIENILAQIPDTFQIMEDVSNEVAVKIALNNYKNAAGFYRKHPLFTILSNVPIQVSEALTITVTSEQWDKFFDETDKKNPDAYKELLPKNEN